MGWKKKPWSGLKRFYCSDPFGVGPLCVRPPNTRTLRRKIWVWFVHRNGSFVSTASVIHSAWRRRSGVDWAHCNARILWMWTTYFDCCICSTGSKKHTPKKKKENATSKCWWKRKAGSGIVATVSLLCYNRLPSIPNNTSERFVCNKIEIIRPICRYCISFISHTRFSTVHFFVVDYTKSSSATSKRCCETNCFN